MRFYSDINMRGNAILECRNLTEFKELTQAEYNELIATATISNNAVYLILDEGTGDILSSYYGQKLLTRNQFPTVALTYEEYTQLLLDDKVNDRIFYCITDDGNLSEKPINQVALTREEYQALLDANAVADDILYIITNDRGLQELDNTIDDTQISKYFTWSSFQINAKLQEISRWKDI